MAIYSINEIAKISGIKPHTIRIWEKRYNLLNPDRNLNNNRFYKETELDQLLNIALLTKHGHKISKLSEMDEKTLSQLADSVRQKMHSPENVNDEIIREIMDFNEESIHRLVLDFINENGIWVTIDQLINPLLERFQILWLTGKINSAHDGFFFNLLRRIFVNLSNDNLLQSGQSKAHFLLIPIASTKQHFGIPLMRYILQQKNIKCTELGIGTTMNDIALAVLGIRPDAIVTIIKESMTKSEFIDMVNNLDEVAVNTKLYIINNFPLETTSKFPTNVRCFPDIHTFMNYIKNKVPDYSLNE